MHVLATSTPYMLRLPNPLPAIIKVCDNRFLTASSFHLLKSVSVCSHFFLLPALPSVPRQAQSQCSRSLVSPLRRFPCLRMPKTRLSKVNLPSCQSRCSLPHRQSVSPSPLFHTRMTETDHLLADGYTTVISPVVVPVTIYGTPSALAILESALATATASYPSSFP